MFDNYTIKNPDVEDPLSPVNRQRIKSLDGVALGMQRFEFLSYSKLQLLRFQGGQTGNGLTIKSGLISRFNSF